MPADDLVEDAAEVGGHSQIPAVVALLAGEAGPAAVDPAAADVLAADDEHRVAVPVVGSAVAVLGHRAPELAHRHDDDVAHAIAEIADEGGDAAAEVVEASAELPRGRSLVHVRVPAACLRERHFETDIRLDELRDLAERLAVGRPRIVGAVL